MVLIGESLADDLAPVQNESERTAGRARQARRGLMGEVGVMRVGRVMVTLESVAALVGGMMPSGRRLASRRKSGNGPPTAWAGRSASPSGMSQRDQRPRRHL